MGSEPRPFRIFLNYRREDASGHAGRLYDALVSKFPAHDVFMDIDTIEPGVDFVEVVQQAVGSCDVLLAMIGQRWAQAPDEAGRRRLENAHDFVRLELEAALGRRIRVIPVLVQGARMPSPAELPEDLQPLTRRNAIELSDHRWRYDVDQLIRVLERARDAAAPPAALPVEEAAPQPRDVAPPAPPQGEPASLPPPPAPPPPSPSPAPRQSRRRGRLRWALLAVAFLAVIGTTIGLLVGPGSNSASAADISGVCARFYQGPHATPNAQCTRIGACYASHLSGVSVIDFERIQQANLNNGGRNLPTSLATAWAKIEAAEKACDLALPRDAAEVGGTAGDT